MGSKRVWTHRTLVLPLTVVVAGALAGCSGAGDGPETVVLDPDLVAADEARARDMVLGPDDAPEGWTVEPPDPGDNLLGGGTGACERPVTAMAHNRTAEAHSHEFTGEQSGFTMSASLYADSDSAEVALAARLDERARRCLTEALTALLDEARSEEVPAAVGVTTDVGRLSVEPVGDDRGAWVAMVSMEMGPVTLRMYADLVAVRVGRAVLDFLFLGFLEPFDGPRAEALDLAVDRARTVLES